MAVFTRYFHRLCNPPVSADKELLGEFQDQTKREQDRVPISEVEVERALKAMYNRRATSTYDIPPELLKQGGSVIVGVMTRLFNVLLEEHRVPAEWKKAIIIPLYINKGSKLDCGNFRGISLILVPSKLFTRILLNRIR